MSQKSEAVVAHMQATVAAITSASASAEALLNATSAHIQSVVANVDSSNQDDVDECLNELEDFAGQLDQQASSLAAAVTANTPADPAAGATVDPHTVAGAAAAGGYNVADGSGPAPAAEQTLPPAAGQHEDAPVEQPQNSTLTELSSGSASDTGGNAAQPSGGDAGTTSEQPSGGDAGTTSEQPASGDAGGPVSDSPSASDTTQESQSQPNIDGTNTVTGDDAA